MGYRELNQRDSYWTSWLHLVFYKDLERKMIEESIEWQQPSGKIPTTILPLIEREDDLDINAFFILRIARFYRYYHNKQDLINYWPAMKKAMNWLISCSGFFLGRLERCEGDRGKKIFSFYLFDLFICFKGNGLFGGRVW